MHNHEALPFGDVAIFYRTNAQSRVLEEELVRHNIPYKVVGGTRFYDRREVRDVLAYLKLLLNPSDEISCRRIVNVPRRGIGDTSADRIATWARGERPVLRGRSRRPGGRRTDRESRQGRASRSLLYWTSCASWPTPGCSPQGCWTQS